MYLYGVQFMDAGVDTPVKIHMLPQSAVLEIGESGTRIQLFGNDYGADVGNTTKASVSLASLELLAERIVKATQEARAAWETEKLSFRD